MEKEKRLIDANALQLEPDPWGGMNGVICLGRSGGKTMATVQAALRCMIDNAPTVDAVEVVRCKDCIYNATGSCEFSEFVDIYYNPNWFCADGKRKDNA